MRRFAIDTTSRDELIRDLHQTIHRLKANHVKTPNLPMISATEARTIGQTLIQIKQLCYWGEFAPALEAIGISQPMASICRRLARDWHLITSHNLESFSAEVAYQKLRELSFLR